jgi:hypothetical protein
MIHLSIAITVSPFNRGTAVPEKEISQKVKERQPQSTKETAINSLPVSLQIVFVKLCAKVAGLWKPSSKVKTYRSISKPLIFNFRHPLFSK